MFEEVSHWRKQQRAALLARRVAVPSATHREWSASVTRWLIEHFRFSPPLVLGFYWPFRGEFDPRFVVRHLRTEGVRVALPVVLHKAAPLEFREWWPGAATRKGVFDLPVPDGTDILRPTALLIPPVGFDAQGYRLGYGGGYFDRTLAAMQPKPLAIGVGFELSRMQTIRPQAHDIAMDFIVTEAGVFRAGPDGLVSTSEKP